MARDPRITPEQHAEESSVQFGLIVDFCLAGSLLVIGIFGGSLTILAESIRGMLMDVIELFSLMIMKRIHRGNVGDLEFGTGKLEQVATTVIGATMLSGAIWITARALGMIEGETALGTPFGLALAAVAGAVNLYFNFIAWARVRATLRTESSLVMVAQVRSRMVKLASSVFVLVTMTIAAFSTDDKVVTWADVIGSLFVAGFMLVNALEMVVGGVTDLLDRSAGRPVHEAIDRTIARHADTCGKPARVRSRRSGRVVFIELVLRFDPRLSLAEVNRRIDELKQSLAREIEHADISVLALAAPD